MGSIMDREFVPLKESLELKEIGFKEPCLFLYRGTREINYFRADPEDFATNSFLGLTTAVLFQQAMRWFREKHGMAGNIHSIYLDETHTDMEYWFWIGCCNNNFNDDDDDTYYKTYEEAELECIRKLIQIIKDKK